MDHVTPLPPPRDPLKLIHIDIFWSQNIIFTKSYDNYHGYLYKHLKLYEITLFHIGSSGVGEVPEWPHRQGGCLTCCGCMFESSWVHWFTLCKRRSGGTAHEGGGCDQSIGSTVSDAIVRSWLGLTATRSSPLGCFSILQVVDNWPHILW